jgi:hypothetical protein
MQVVPLVLLHRCHRLLRASPQALLLVGDGVVTDDHDVRLDLLVHALGHRRFQLRHTGPTDKMGRCDLDLVEGAGVVGAAGLAEGAAGLTGAGADGRAEQGAMPPPLHGSRAPPAGAVGLLERMERERGEGAPPRVRSEQRGSEWFSLS